MFLFENIVMTSSRHHKLSLLVHFTFYKSNTIKWFDNNVPSQQFQKILFTLFNEELNSNHGTTFLFSRSKCSTKSGWKLTTKGTMKVTAISPEAKHFTPSIQNYPL